jgi:hypothetical protein
VVAGVTITSAAYSCKAVCGCCKDRGSDLYDPVKLDELPADVKRILKGATGSTSAQGSTGTFNHATIYPFTPYFY